MHWPHEMPLVDTMPDISTDGDGLWLAISDCQRIAPFRKPAVDPSHASSLEGCLIPRNWGIMRVGRGKLRWSSADA